MAMNFPLHRCVLDKSQDGRGADFSRPLVMPSSATALGAGAETYEVKSQEQLLDFLGKLGAADDDDVYYPKGRRPREDEEGEESYEKQRQRPGKGN